MQWIYFLGAMLFLSACEARESTSEKEAGEKAQKQSATAAESDSARDVAPPTERGPSPPSTQLQISNGQGPGLARLSQAAQTNFKICSEICAVTATLRCAPPEECARACLEMSLLPQCGAELEAFLKCSVEQPLKNFECSEGQPTLLEGHCSQQQRAFFACLQAASQ